jgi:hypothetical protein
MRGGKETAHHLLGGSHYSRESMNGSAEALLLWVGERTGRRASAREKSGWGSSSGLGLTISQTKKAVYGERSWYTVVNVEHRA